MSALSELLATAKEVQVELEKAANSVTSAVKSKVENLVQNLEHEVEKETSNLAQKPTAAPGEGLNTTSDVPSK